MRSIRSRFDYAAVIQMATDLAVAPENMMLDDVGG